MTTVRIADLPGRLLRITSGRRLIPEIDGLRAVAILSVILYHLNGYAFSRTVGAVSAAQVREWPLYQFLSAGHVGVQIFFVISGFIVILPFIERGQGVVVPRVRPYYARRLARIMPPYAINLVLLTVLILVFRHGRALSVLPHFLASLGYVHMLAYGEPSTINYLAWSLEVEIQFYLVAPLLALVFLLPQPGMRRGLVAFLAAACMGIAWSLPPSPLINGTLLGQAPFFLAGILLADLHANSVGAGRRSWGYDAAGLAAWVGIFVLQQWLDGGGSAFSPLGYPLHALLPILVFVACLCALRGPSLRALLSNRWLVSFGGMCYTIYLYHYVLISAVGSAASRLGVTGGYAGTLAVCGVVSLCVIACVCSVAYLLFEKPFMARDWPAGWKLSASGRLASLLALGRQSWDG